MYCILPWALIHGGTICRKGEGHTMAAFSPILFLECDLNQGIGRHLLVVPYSDKNCFVNLCNHLENVVMKFRW
jgi:hypothetical protein